MAYVDVGSWTSASTGQQWESQSVQYSPNQDIGLILLVQIPQTWKVYSYCTVSFVFNTALPYKVYYPLIARYPLLRTERLYFPYRTRASLEGDGNISVRIERFSIYKGADEVGDVTFNPRLNVV